MKLFDWSFIRKNGQSGPNVGLRIAGCDSKFWIQKSSNPTSKLTIFFFLLYSKNLTNWEKFQLNIRQYELYHETDQYIDDLLKDLAKMPIVRVGK